MNTDVSQHFQQPDSGSGESATLREWICALKDGNEEAAKALWERFYLRIRAYASDRIGNFVRRDVDEDDLVQSAFRSVFDGARQGRFETLESGEDFWQLLVIVASTKISRAQRLHRRSHEVGESALYNRTDPSTMAPLEYVPDRATPAHDIDGLASECEEMLAGLEPKLRRVALLRLAGYSNQEIAAQIERSVKTVEHYFRMIRLRWHGS